MVVGGSVEVLKLIGGRNVFCSGFKQSLGVDALRAGIQASIHLIGKLVFPQ